MPDINIELEYDSQDAIPEGVRGLFDEQDGKFRLTGVQGLKTQKDVNNVQEALRKEREDHSTAKSALKAWEGLKPDEVRAQLDEYPTLKAAAEGKLDDEKINGLVESKLTQKTAPLQRQLETISTENNDLKTENEKLKMQMERRDLNDVVRSVSKEMKVVDSAVEDVEMVAAAYFERNEAGEFVTKADVQGVTPGVDMQQFLKEMQKKRPHWWPASEGGGAGNLGEYGGSANPWSKDGWNMTQQSQVYREKGAEFATKLAKAAGTSIGGTRPTK